MRVRYSFSSRHTKRALDSPKMKKQREKYPEALKKIIERSHVILEVLDARFIENTRNEEIEKEILSKGKAIIYVINKADLNKNLEILPKPNAIVSTKDRRGIKNLRNMIKRIAAGFKKDKEGKVYIGVIGYPNTGKSSLINILIGKNSAKTGDEAGFTKGIQKLRLSRGLILLDSPGVIPSKEYSSISTKLASDNTKVGARSYSQVKNPEQVVSDIMNEFPNVLEKHYEIPEAKGDSEVLIEKLGEKRKLFIKGGYVDTDRAARFILKDWQAGKIKI